MSLADLPLDGPPGYQTPPSWPGRGCVPTRCQVDRAYGEGTCRVSRSGSGAGSIRAYAEGTAAIAPRWVLRTGRSARTRRARPLLEQPDRVQGGRSARTRRELLNLNVGVRQRDGGSIRARRARLRARRVHVVAGSIRAYAEGTRTPAAVDSAESGRSARTRRALRLVGLARNVVGSIRAYAEGTGPRTGQPWWKRVDPRVRGGHHSEAQAGIVHSGRSAGTRGAPLLTWVFGGGSAVWALVWWGAPAAGEVSKLSRCGGEKGDAPRGCGGVCVRCVG